MGRSQCSSWLVINIEFNQSAESEKVPTYVDTNSAMSGDPVPAKFPTSHFWVLHVDSRVMIFCLGSSKSSAFPVDILELPSAPLCLGNPFRGTVSSFPG